MTSLDIVNNVNEQIIEKRKTDSEFDTLWQESRNEYKLLAELVKIRKEANYHDES